MGHQPSPKYNCRGWTNFFIEAVAFRLKEENNNRAFPWSSPSFFLQRSAVAMPGTSFWLCLIKEEEEASHKVRLLAFLMAVADHPGSFKRFVEQMREQELEEMLEAEQVPLNGKRVIFGGSFLAVYLSGSKIASKPALSLLIIAMASNLTATAATLIFDSLHSTLTAMASNY